MGQDTQAPPHRASKRKAWTYAPETAPPFKDLFAGGERRKAAVKYWIKQNLENANDIFMYFALKLLPARACSDFGANLARYATPRWHKGALRRATATLLALRPEASDAELAQLLDAYADSQGRQMSEYSVVERLAHDKRRLRFEGTEGLAAATADGPTIFISTHTANWEVMWCCLIDMGIKLTLNYAPPRQRSRHWIVNRVRTGAGLDILKPGRSAVRPALRLLEDGGNLLVFCDEGFNGQIRGPFLGMEPHLSGNLGLVARLARKTGARICLVYIVRDGGTRFTLHAEAPFHLPEGDSSEANLIEDVKLLNSKIEPIIRAYPEQWYFVDNALPPR
ncbi:lysophospholipid acyltransferase family protein [Ensifer sp. MJa1]|uniref:lysophospholipid acyltransferase family protein n=1 Tax=Ensifer sp. MJa1 TaxID=2919888 RepID=UPI00300BF2D5